jgi:hypothetical protein
VSLLCESSWAIGLSAATGVAPPYREPTTALMQMLVWRKHFDDRNFPSPGLFAAPYLEFPELLLISNVKPIEKYFAFDPRTETKCQLHSQGKLTTPRRENRKILQYQKNMLPKGRNLRSIEWYQTTYVQICWDYLFKIWVKNT